MIAHVAITNSTASALIPGHAIATTPAAIEIRPCAITHPRASPEPRAPSDNANTAGSVPQKLTENHAGGDAWRMPTDAELAPLFAGARGNLGEHLNGRFATTGRFSGQPFIWTSNRVNQNMNYDRANRGDYEEVWYITVSTQKGYVVDQNGTRSIGQQVMAHDYTLKTRQNAEARRDHNFATLRGGIILTRNTLGTDYM